MYCLRSPSTQSLKAGQDLEAHSSALNLGSDLRPFWRLLFIGLGSSDVIFSEEPDLFLQFVFLPLSQMIKGRHGHAKDPVELLW